MKVFVTGATGLIGGAAVRALVSAGHQVIGLTSQAKNVRIIEKAGATAIVGDMRNAAVYKDAVHSAEAVIHAAAAMPNKMRYSRADVDAFLGSEAEAVDALLSVLGPSCRVFLFSSGAYVYGDTGPSPVDETHTTANHHLIMRRKLATEAKLLDLARSGKVPAVIARPGLVYGDGSLWAWLYLNAMKKGRRAMIPGRGDNIISFIHEDDVGTAYRVLVENPRPGEIYNLADDVPSPLRDVVFAQAEAMGAPPPFSVPAWLIRLIGGPYSGPPPLAHNSLSNRKLKALGWSCKYPKYTEGVEALARSLRS